MAYRPLKFLLFRFFLAGLDQELTQLKRLGRDLPLFLLEQRKVIMRLHSGEKVAFKFQ